MSDKTIRTTGDARRLILDTIQKLHTGEAEIGRSMAIFAGMKVLNDSLQVEINAAKTAMQASKEGHDFGKVVSMGVRVIASEIE